MTGSISYHLRILTMSSPSFCCILQCEVLPPHLGSFYSRFIFIYFYFFLVKKPHFFPLLTQVVPTLQGVARPTSSRKSHPAVLFCPESQWHLLLALIRLHLTEFGALSRTKCTLLGGENGRLYPFAHGGAFEIEIIVKTDTIGPKMYAPSLLDASQ